MPVSKEDVFPLFVRQLISALACKPASMKPAVMACRDKAFGIMRFFMGYESPPDERAKERIKAAGMEHPVTDGFWPMAELFGSQEAQGVMSNGCVPVAMGRPIIDRATGRIGLEVSSVLAASSLQPEVLDAQTPPRANELCNGFKDVADAAERLANEPPCTPPFLDSADPHDV